MNRSIWSVLVITMTILLVVTATASAAPGNGKGNAWGRIAREMQEEKSPGSIAALVHQLKAGTVELEQPADEEEETEVDEPSVDVPVMVTIHALDTATDEDADETTYTVTVLVPGEEGEEPIEVVVEVDEDLYDALSELEEGVEVELDVDEDGNYVLRIVTPDEEIEESDE